MKTPLILCIALLPILTSAQDKPVFKAGAATSNITPPLGMTIVGNFAPQPGYLPTPKQHDLGGYETWFGTNRVEREASEKIAARALELLQSVRIAP